MPLRRVALPLEAGWTTVCGAWRVVRGAAIRRALLCARGNGNDDYTTLATSRSVQRSARGNELPDEAPPRTFPPSMIWWRTGTEVA
jgi:hypothetical protein